MSDGQELPEEFLKRNSIPFIEFFRTERFDVLKKIPLSHKIGIKRYIYNPASNQFVEV